MRTGFGITYAPQGWELSAKFSMGMHQWNLKVALPKLGQLRKFYALG
jgi:hypothetical protein